MQDAEFSGQYCTTTLDCTRDQPVVVHGWRSAETKGGRTKSRKAWREIDTQGLHADVTSQEDQVGLVWIM